MPLSTQLSNKALITKASTAYRCLDGVVCLYKPLGYSYKRARTEFKVKICAELNELEPPPREERVEVRRVNILEGRSQDRIPLENETILASFPDGDKHQVQVVKGISYSDHPLILGKRYKPEDIKIIGTGSTTPEVSGVHLFGVNHRGIQTAKKIFAGRWLRTFQVSGRFGIGTETFFHTGRIVEKSTYGNVKQHLFQNFLLSMQASHQKMAFEAAGVPIDSERAYELASQGVVRPATFSHPIVYSLKMTRFKLPDFTIEMKVVNAEFEYLKRLIHNIGLKNHSTAVCTKIHCTNVGPFGVDDALLLKHWSLENVLDNMNLVKEKLKMFNMLERDPWVTDKGNKEAVMTALGSQQFSEEEEEEEEEE